MAATITSTTFLGIVLSSLHLLIQLQAITSVHAFTLTFTPSSRSSPLPLSLSPSKSYHSYNTITTTRPTTRPTTRTTTHLSANNANNDDDNNALSLLPRGISPFEKSISKSIDVQADFRSRAKAAVDAALASSSGDEGVQLLEIEFPPLLGGSSSKSQFDDFDNVQELDSNKNWAIQFAPLFLTEDDNSPYGNGKTWLIFPDLKECELARIEWPGKRYMAATFTTLKAATEFLVSGGGESKGYSAPWGAALAEGFNKILGSTSSDNDDDVTNSADGGDSSTKKKTNDAGLLGDVSSLTPLVQGKNSPPALNIVVQPGNGGPVEDWINVEAIYDALVLLLGSGSSSSSSSSSSSVILIVNGALDKVRDGYYPPIFFPKLAKTVDRFYRKFETVFYLKPITDKGLYGWLYRTYPEPWQVVLQTVRTKTNGDSYIEDTVVYTSMERPSYAVAISKMVEKATTQA